jgi:hypothetical protein
MKMKQFRILALLGLLVCPELVEGQTANPGNLPAGTVTTKCVLSVTTVVNLFTACVAAGATQAAMNSASWAMIANEGAAYRFWSDGTTATTSSGMPVASGTAIAPTYMALTSSLGQTSIVAQSGTATLDIEFIR